MNDTKDIFRTIQQRQFVQLKNYYDTKGQKPTCSMHVDLTSLYPFFMMAIEYMYQYGKTEKRSNTTEFDTNWFGFIKCKFLHKHRDNMPLHAVVTTWKLGMKQF